MQPDCRPDQVTACWPALQSLLILGSAGSWVPSANATHLDVRTCEWSPECVAALPGTYDLAVCMNAPAKTAEECEAIAFALAPLCERILFSAEVASSENWLRALLAAGYKPDLAFDAQWAGDGALLLQRREGSCDLIPVLSELLRLRSRTAAADRQAAHLRKETESLLAEVRAITLAAREQQEVFIRKADLRISQLHARTNQLSHSVNDILRSRIWKTLVTLGGWILSVQRIRFSSRNPGPTRRHGTDGFIALQCDEPASEAWDRMLQSGISGRLKLKGWAVATSGIARVEVQLGDSQPIAARQGLHRPDVEQLYPSCSDALLSGFVAEADTQTVPSGPSRLKIRAFGTQGEATEIEVPLKVDHIHGYADDYHRWIRDFESREPREIELRLSLLKHRPRISLIVPVYKTQPVILEKAISSVLTQSYADWELCLVDDCSQSPELTAILERHAASDRRIKVAALPVNGGISAASNEALTMATGDFIGLLDHDDELAPDALLYVAEALNREPDTDMIYSDEDHIDDGGMRSDPFFKPDWSPDLLLGENYVCHFLVLRTSLCRELGGFRSEMDLSQDSDIALRASVKARRIVHIPRVLYHWRTNVYTGDRASDAQRERALVTSRRAVEEHLKSQGVDATVEPGAVASRWRVRYAIPGDPAVRILVPCGGNVDLLKRCLGPLVEKTRYRNFQISVIDNSRGHAVADWVRKFSHRGHTLSYVDYRNRPFNFSAMNNTAAREVHEPFLLFLNDDISIIQGDWLTAMMELGARPEVGAVGAKLLYPDNTIQHAGVVVGIFGTCGHGFKGAFAADRIYFDFPHLIRNVSAVTGACMLVPAEKFRACGGFDEEAFPVSYNDIDLCLKLGEKGYRILYTPHAQLYHHEAASKRSPDKDPRPAETMIFKSRWQRVIEHDPFYSPNLALDVEDYSFRKGLD